MPWSKTPWSPLPPPPRPLTHLCRHTSGCAPTSPQPHQRWVGRHAPGCSSAHHAALPHHHLGGGTQAQHTHRAQGQHERGRCESGTAIWPSTSLPVSRGTPRARHTSYPTRPTWSNTQRENTSFCNGSSCETLSAVCFCMPCAARTLGVKACITVSMRLCTTALPPEATTATSPPPQLTQCDALDASNEVRQSRVLHQVLQLIAVSSRNQLHTTLWRRKQSKTAAAGCRNRTSQHAVCTTNFSSVKSNSI
jgi:hypothetical protein